MDSLIDKTAAFDGQRIDVFVFDNSIESSLLTTEIFIGLNAARWQPHIWYVLPNGSPPNGVRVEILDGSNEKTKAAAASLVSALIFLRNSGLRLGFRSIPESSWTI